MGFLAACEEEGGASCSTGCHGSPRLGTMTATKKGDKFISGDKGAREGTKESCPLEGFFDELNKRGSEFSVSLLLGGSGDEAEEVRGEV